MCGRRSGSPDPTRTIAIVNRHSAPPDRDRCNPLPSPWIRNEGLFSIHGHAIASSSIAKRIVVRGVHRCECREHVDIARAPGARADRTDRAQ